MALPDAVVRHDRALRVVSAAALLQARRSWGRLGTGDWNIAWRMVGTELTALMVAAQIAVGRLADGYVAAVVDELDIPPATVGRMSPRGLSGVASDGRPLMTLLESALISARMSGGTTAEALAAGRDVLDRIVTTQVADASRAAVSVASVARPAIMGTVRMANPPCCERCAILAGRWYRWSKGFERHPGCDCYHVPGTQPDAELLYRDNAGANTERMFADGQVRGLSKADAQAIADGADPYRVVNARRGMSVAGDLKATTEGTTRRGVFPSQGVRLRPEAIYELASDRDDAIRMLRQYRYITD